MLWVAWMIMGRFDGASPPFEFTANAVWWVLILSAGAAVATATSPYPALHRSAMAASSAIYVAVLATHTVLLLAGNDVLAPLALGDYGGLPLLMLACAFSGQWVVPAAAVVLVDSVLTNHNVVDAGAWHQLLAVAHSLVLLMPFLYFLYTASRATQAMDRLAARTLGTSLELAKQGWVKQNRARFLGYIHDQVLPVLAGIPMGVSTLADLDHLPEAFEGGKSGTVELALVVRTWSTTFTLRTLPDTFANLSGVEEIHLRGLNALTSIPDVFSGLNALTELKIIDADSLTALPASIGQASNLRMLAIDGNGALKSLPESLGQLNNLTELGVEGNGALNAFPAALSGLTSLEDARIHNNASKTLPTFLVQLPNLREVFAFRTPESDPTVVALRERGVTVYI